MPDIDRTQVVIETNIDDRKAAKKIDDLEKKLDKLEEPRTIDLNADYDRVFSRLQQELASVNQRISDMFKKSKSMNNIPGMGEAVERKSALQNAIQELKKTGPGISPDQLSSILEGVGYKLDSNTISELNTGGEGQSAEQLKDATIEMHQMAMDYNKLISDTRNKSKPLSPEDLEKTNGKIEELKTALLAKGVSENDFNKNGYLNYQGAWESIMKKQDAKEGKNDTKNNFGKLAGAIVGIQGILQFVKRIASQNDNITQAMNNITSVLASILAPVLNVIASIINTIASFLGSIFKVNSKTAKSTGATATAVKNLAGFDEITNIGGGAEGGAGAGTSVDPGKFQWLLDFLEGLWQLLKGLFQFLAGLIGGIFTTAIGVVQGIIAAVAGIAGTIIATIIGVIRGTIYAIIALIQGIFNTVKTWIGDLINVVVGMFTGFIEGFNKAREEGHGIIVSIFLGLWESFKQTVGNIWTAISNLFTNIWNTIKNVVGSFISQFKEGFLSVYNWFIDKLINPIITSIGNVFKAAQKMFDYALKGWDNIKYGFRKFINGIIGMVNWVIGCINKLPGVSIGYVSYLASGGMPQKGSMFIAGEAGPELVGRMGTNSAVMNNDQIVDSVSRGVAEAVSAVLGNGGQDVNIYLDGRVLGSAVVNYINKESRVLGARVV